MIDELKFRQRRIDQSICRYDVKMFEYSFLKNITTANFWRNSDNDAVKNFHEIIAFRLMLNNLKIDIFFSNIFDETKNETKNFDENEIVLFFNNNQSNNRLIALIIKFSYFFINFITFLIEICFVKSCVRIRIFFSVLNIQYHEWFRACWKYISIRRISLMKYRFLRTQNWIDLI